MSFIFLLKMFRQVIDGLEHLMAKGYYHGNFSLMDTYYQQRDSEATVKLRNFKRISKKTITVSNIFSLSIYVVWMQPIK